MSEKTTFDHVADMVKAGEEAGLLVEVVHTFGMLMAGKRDEIGRVPDNAIQVAASGALLDWDC